MPETIRTENGSGRARFRHAGFACLMSLSGTACAASAAASTEGSVLAYAVALGGLDRQDVFGIALTVGTIAFGVLASLLLLRARRGAAKAKSQSDAEMARLRDDLHRLHAIVDAEPQVLVIWPAGSEEPEILGDPGIV